MVDLKEIWYSDQYKEIREKVQDRLCFICLSGSHAYGTNIAISDIDIRGVMLPTKEQLIGLNRFEQQEDNTTDTVIFELNKFIKLVSDCNPNVIEMLGSPQILIFNNIGEELIENAKMFLSKKCIHTFGGFAKAQLNRIENALSHDSVSEEQQIKHLKNSMDLALDKLKCDNIKITNENNKIYFDVNFKHTPLEDIRGFLNSVLNIEKTYNQLSRRNRKKDLNHLQKHVMHLIRLYLMCFDILEKEKIVTYRKDDIKLLRDIRSNKKFLIDNKLTDDFYDYLKELETRLDKDRFSSKLPEKPNYKEIEKLVIKFNTFVINNTVLFYKDPIELKEIT